MENEMLGCVEGLSDDDYRQAGGLTSTVLRQCLQAPAKAAYGVSHPGMGKATEAFVTGRLCHAMVLEPEAVSGRFAVMPEGLKRTTKEGKRVYGELVAEVGEENVVSQAQMQVAVGVRDSVMAHERAGKYFALGEPELSVFARDPVTDVLLQCRCDWLCRYPPVIVDLKTSVTASAEGFARHAVQYGYHLQAVHYQEVCRLAGIEAEAFLFVAVEKEPPYLCQVFQLSEVLRDTALVMWRQGVNAYARCLSSGDWPGYGTDIIAIEQPRWMAA